MSKGNYAVIGAGWAGCTAAVQLAKAGHRVHLFEAARTLGGRARQVLRHDLTLDNGQHILLGAYQETLALLKLLGIDCNTHFLRVPMQLRYPDDSGGIHLHAVRLPAPLNMAVGLLRAKGLSNADKMALARFFTSARWMGWQLHHDCTVLELLHRFEQTEAVIRFIWRPLCIAALNTPIERASAQVFLNVLHDSIGAKRRASDILIPQCDLSRLVPQPAADFICARDGQIYLGSRVQALSRRGEQWQLTLQPRHPPIYDYFDGVVIATPSDVAKKLLGSVGLAEHIPHVDHEPITTCYLKYSPHVTLPCPFFALVDHYPLNHFGQFVFDRGHIDRHQAGVLAVVMSASHKAIEYGHPELADHCAQQLAHTLKRPDLLHPEWHFVVTEKHATFSCAPNLIRPSNQLAIPNLVIAGDYTEGRYPATLEAAVLSGAKAVDLITSSIKFLRS